MQRKKTIKIRAQDRVDNSEFQERAIDARFRGLKESHEI